jgi:hypothetical protein
MEEQKTTTYGDLKIRKAELQTEMLKGNFEEYKKLLVWIKQAESALLCVLVLLILFVGGCGTFKGMTGDSSWLLGKISDNIVIEK